MRTNASFALWAALCLASAGIRAQQNAGQTAPPLDTYSIVSRTPNSRVWQMPWVETNLAGIVRTNVDSYTEVRSGLCYLVKGVYVDSSEQIDIVADGAQAIHGQHHVHWAANANTPGGALRITTVGGALIQSTVWGISYWDASTGNNVLLGNVQDSQGEQIGNQVIYQNAFNGGLVTADINYTYTVEGLEQNVVFREQLPDPQKYGLNPDSTYLQVLSEFFNPPAPTVQSIPSEGVTNDAFLNFGDMSIGIGQAFLATNENGMISAGLVGKEWVNIENRQFLIEELPYSSISVLQDALPEHASVAQPSKRITRMAALKEKPPLTKPRDFGKVRVASVYKRKPGLVIDYNLVNNATNVTFQGDTTYYVSGTINIYGTNVFEGGAVIKFTNNGSITEAASPQTPKLSFLTAPYLPVVFTSKDDNSVGQIITGSTGNPFTNFCANPALSYGSSSGSITNIRISYAKQGLSIASTNPVSLTDLQFVNCTDGISVGGTGLVTLRNALFARIGADFNGTVANAALTAEHVTASSNQYLVQYSSTSGVSFKFTNCIFASVTNLTNSAQALSGNNNGFFSTRPFGSTQLTNTSYPFQAVGAASYYLASGSSFLNAGTTNLDAAMLADLAQKTVYPPLTINAVYTNSLTIYPQAQRDTGTPSLGYHYDPLDWAGAFALSNSVISVLPGAAFGGAGTAYGIWEYANSSVTCQGTATAPIHFTRYNTVQEQSNPTWESTGWQQNFITQENFSSKSTASFQFTTWTALAEDGHFYAVDGTRMSFLAFANNQFYNGSFQAADPALGVTNCLFRRVNTLINDGSDAYPYYFYNNLFTGGSVSTFQANGGAWTFKDNLFDTTNMVYFGPLGSNDTCNYNGYLITNTLTGPKNTNDVILPNTNSPAYQISFLGSYYYPTNQTNLLHKGSRTADLAGLYHYTMTTNQVIESNSVVGIGFHYVATDNNGNPLDTDGDGTPDYIEDSNGDGTFDAGDLSNWLSYNSPNGLTSPNGVIVFTPLK